MRFQFFGSFLK